jgi:hypothetical protein
MYQPINQVRLRGFLTESARLFVSRSGQPRITFRMEVWIDDENLPPKKPAGVDYFSVVAFGTEFVNLLPHLAPGGGLRNRIRELASSFSTGTRSHARGSAPQSRCRYRRPPRRH